MLGKNNFYMNQKKSGRKFEKYSIKKLKVGAASVLVGAGFFLGFHVEASEVNEPATNEVVSSSPKDQKEKVSEAPKVVAEIEEKTNQATPSVDNQLVEEKNTNVATEKATPVEEKTSTIVEKAEQPTDEKKAIVETSKLVDKMTALQEQVDRVRSNEKQKSLVEKAEKLLEEAKALQKSSSATQPEVDAKTKEISSLTSILKSIKAEETPKENKNQDSRNGKKMEEGTGFRTGGVTDQALTGSIHFDTSKGPTEKRIPVANNGDGERVINMAITYSASSDETVTDGKIRVTIPKAFLHSTKKPEFTNSSFVKSTDDRSTATDYVYDLNLNPMAGGSVAESLLKLYVGTSIKNAPSEGDSLPVKTEFISGENVLSTKTATATFDYLSEIIYRENDRREKLVKNYLSQDQREYKLGSVVNGKLTPVKTPFRIPLIMTNEPFFNSGEADGWNQNGNGRLTSYDYTISGIPEFLELDPNSSNNSKWTLKNGVATLHPDQTRGIENILVYAGPVLKLKEGALSTPEEIAKVIESNGTKGYNAKIVYKAVGHRPDGSSFTQTLEDPDGFRIYAGDGAPSIGNMDDYINTQSNQRLFSNASNVDTFGATYTVPYHKLKADGGTLPSQYLSYLIPKDQEGNYFTRFKMYQVATNELENGNAGVKGYHAGYKDLRGQFKENFKLYGVNENNQAELIKEYMNIDELFSEITINPDKRYNHLILKTPGIVDELQDREQASKTIIGLTTNLDVTVGTWKEKAKDPNIQRYEDKISQVLAAENTLESAVATQRPNTGASNPAVHTKEATTLHLSMDQIGKRDLSKDNLTRGQNIPITVSYEAPDYFYLAESDKNGIKTYDLQKLDPNINKTSVMLLADPKLPLKDFRLTADNRLLSSTSIYYGGVNSEDGNWAYNRIKENYDTVNPTRIIENYKGTGKRAYIFESKDLGLSSFDLNRDGWIKGGTYKPAALTFEVENNGQIQSGTYNIESYLVWNSDAETLFGNDRSLNADYVEGHESGRTIAKSNINITMNNVIEYSTSLTISKPGTTGTRGIIDVKNGQEVILTPQIENLTDTPQKIKEAVVLIPKSEAVTYLEGHIAENSDEYDIEYTTSTAADKTQGTYVTANQITNWKDVTAVKYKFKKDYTVTKQHSFTHNFNLRVDPENQNFVQSTSQIFLKNNQNVWLESNIVGLRTEDVRGKLEVRYINNRKDDILPKISKRDFAGEPYTTTKEDLIKYNYIPYLFKEIQADSVPESGTYERQVTKKVTYVYEEATFKEESKTITRTINYLEKNNESNVVANPVVQNITVTRKVYTGKETGRVVEGPWEYPTDAYQPNWPRTNSPRVPNFEAPDREVIDKVLVSQELINNGNVVENVYYERIVPVGGDVVAKYVIEGTTTELKQETDVAKGLKVGKEYTSTAPAAGEELTATDGKVYVYKGHKTTSAAETGTVTTDKQEVVYEYAPKIGGDVEVKYVIAGTEENLKDPVTLVTGRQVGSDYTATKDATITKDDGRVYKLVEANSGLKTGSAGETGKVTTEKQTVTYEYELQKGDVTVNYTDTEGNPIEGKTSVVVENQSPTGKEYTTKTPELKPETITTESGKVYKLVPDQTVGKETGKVTVDPISVTYKYELQKGNVTVNYTDVDGQPIEGKTSVVVENQSPTGKEYTTKTPELKPETITTESGKVYKLVPDQTVGQETGKVTVDPISVTYKYELQKGNVTVKYENEAGEIIKPDNNLKSQVPTGDDYNTTTVKDLTITKDGKLYKLVEKNGGVKEGSSVENGKVTETPAVVTYVYSEVKGEIIQKFVNESGKEIKDPINTGKKSLNEKVNLEHPNRITDKDGKVYEFVKVDKIPTNFTEQPQTATYTYRVVKGQGVTVSYETTTGVTLKETQTVQPKDTQLGTEYDTTTSNFKPERIEKDGKVYILKEQTKPGSAEEKGKVTEQPQKVTYVYEEVKEPETKQKYGNVIVTYVDKFGHPLSGTTETGVKVDKSVIDTPASLVKTPYDTTDNKPQTITTAEGKVYKLLKVTQHSDAENSDVKGRTSVITYVYELQNTTEELQKAHIGFVVVNYVDVDGYPISGKSTEGKEIPTTVMDVNGDLVGTKYDTTDHKPTTITTSNGDVYEFVKKSETSAPESGELKEGVATVEYVYRKVVTTYVDEEGKEINPSDKGTKDKKDIPEYIFKETKKDEKGNTTHVYRQVVTSYVDEEGKEINPSDKGTKDKKEISGYTFKQTKKDKDGNTIHVYTKKSSSTPETPNTDESKSTIWKSVDGETLKPRENGTKDKASIPGYEFVRTEKDKEGNTVHIYRKVTSSTPEVKEKETSYVDENGKEIRSTKKGKQPKENIPGYEFVRTEEDSNGNVRHEYRQVTHSESKVETPTTVQEHKNELPNTGTGDEFTIFGAAAASILAGLGIAIPGKKKED